MREPALSRVAAVDCGTNSVRLLIADASGSGTPVERHREMRIVRLGEGVDRTGRLSAEALARTGAALADYAALCRDHGAGRVRVVATSATRDAGNREDFRQLVLGTLGVEPEVLSGAAEAELSFRGATAGRPAGEAPFLVVDIGGGSTEVVLGSDRVDASCSVDIGCVRLTERHLHDDPPSPAQVRAAEADIARALATVATAVPVRLARTALGLAGSVTTVAALALELPAYDASAIHGRRLTLEAVEHIAARLLSMRREDRAALRVVHSGRVDVIAAGALVLRDVLRAFGLDSIVASEADILDGIVASLRSPDNLHP